MIALCCRARFSLSRARARSRSRSHIRCVSSVRLLLRFFLSIFYDDKFHCAARAKWQTITKKLGKKTERKVRVCVCILRARACVRDMVGTVRRVASVVEPLRKAAATCARADLSQ